jgi:hypothetical protein
METRRIFSGEACSTWLSFVTFISIRNITLSSLQQQQQQQQQQQLEYYKKKKKQTSKSVSLSVAWKVNHDEYCRLPFRELNI